jgi:hypothetical protein
MFENPNLPTRPTEFVTKLGDEKSVVIMWSCTLVRGNHASKFQRTSSLGRKEEAERKDEQKTTKKAIKKQK